MNLTFTVGVEGVDTRVSDVTHGISLTEELAAVLFQGRPKLLPRSMQTASPPALYAYGGDGGETPRTLHSWQ